MDSRIKDLGPKEMALRRLQRMVWLEERARLAWMEWVPVVTFLLSALCSVALVEARMGLLGAVLAVIGVVGSIALGGFLEKVRDWLAWEAARRRYPACFTEAPDFLRWRFEETVREFNESTKLFP
jgi:uncharacterized membrane protein